MSWKEIIFKFATAKSDDLKVLESQGRAARAKIIDREIMSEMSKFDIHFMGIAFNGNEMSSIHHQLNYNHEKVQSGKFPKGGKRPKREAMEELDSEDGKYDENVPRKLNRIE